MKVLLQHRATILIPDSEDERATLEDWRASHDDFVFRVNAAGGKGVALLAPGPRPLVHKVRRDSRTIPGVIMAEIWMALRDSLLRSRAPAPKPKGPGP